MNRDDVQGAAGCLTVLGFFGLWLTYVGAVLALLIGAAIFVWKHI